MVAEPRDLSVGGWMGAVQNQTCQTKAGHTWLRWWARKWESPWEPAAGMSKKHTLQRRRQHNWWGDPEAEQNIRDDKSTNSSWKSAALLPSPEEPGMHIRAKMSQSGCYWYRLLALANVSHWRSTYGNHNARQTHGVMQRFSHLGRSRCCTASSPVTCQQLPQSPTSHPP